MKKKSVYGFMLVAFCFILVSCGNVFSKVQIKAKPSIYAPLGKEEFKNFVKRQSMYKWWSRCEYEIILSDWPSQCQQKKIDVHYQVMANLDAVTKVLIESINDC